MAQLGEEARRLAEGRADAQSPTRPDHGPVLVDDIGKDENPGSSRIGRLKGSAEIRRVRAAGRPRPSGEPAR